MANNPEITPKIPSGHGVFDSTTIPEGWRKPETPEKDLGLFAGEIHRILPDSEILFEIPRSSNSVTFVLRDKFGLEVFQFGPEIKIQDKSLNLRDERLNPYKFTGLEQRFMHLYQVGVKVPRVFQTGMSFGLNRTFAVMEFVKGISADRLLQDAAELTGQVFYHAGRELGRLAEANLTDEDDPHTGATEYLIAKQRAFISFLVKNEVLNQDEAKMVENRTISRIVNLGEFPVSYVHMDPFPVNWMVSGPRHDISLTMIDLEAVLPGHPWIEGIGRALQWAASDWFHIRGNHDSARLFSRDMLDGFNSAVSDNLRVPDDLVDSGLIAEISELIWLPRGITFEMLRDKPGETPDRRKRNLMDLVKQ